MTFVPRPRHDYGIVYGMNGGAVATYTDRFNRAIPYQTLQASLTAMLDVDSSIFYPGLTRGLSIWVEVLINPGGATSIDVQVQGSPSPLIDAGFTGWPPIPTIETNAMTPAITWSFTASGTYLLQTASEFTIDRMRLSAKAQGTALSGDTVTIKAIGLP